MEGFSRQKGKEKEADYSIFMESELHGRFPHWCWPENNRPTGEYHIPGGDSNYS